MGCCSRCVRWAVSHDPTGPYGQLAVLCLSDQVTSLRDSFMFLNLARKSHVDVKAGQDTNELHAGLQRAADRSLTVALRNWARIAKTSATSSASAAGGDDAREEDRPSLSSSVQHRSSTALHDAAPIVFDVGATACEEPEPALPLPPQQPPPMTPPSTTAASENGHAPERVGRKLARPTQTAVALQPAAPNGPPTRARVPRPSFDKCGTDGLRSRSSKPTTPSHDGSSAASQRQPHSHHRTSSAPLFLSDGAWSGSNVDLWTAEARAGLVQQPPMEPTPGLRQSKSMPRTSREQPDFASPVGGPAQPWHTPQSGQQPPPTSSVDAPPLAAPSFEGPFGQKLPSSADDSHSDVRRRDGSRRIQRRRSRSQEPTNSADATSGVGSASDFAVFPASPVPTLGHAAAVASGGSSARFAAGSHSGGAARFRREHHKDVHSDVPRTPIAGDLNRQPPAKPCELPSKETLLLPLDYSGMQQLDEGKPALDDSDLLGQVDGQARMALKAQVSQEGQTRDQRCTVLHLFRDFLRCNIPLPRPAAVELEQALKDAARERIQVQDTLFEHDATGVQAALRELISPLAADEAILTGVCADILRAASRTASGGDAYAVVKALLAPGEETPLTPAQGMGYEQPAPIRIDILDRSVGSVRITTEDNFFLHNDEESMMAQAEAAAAQAHGELEARDGEPEEGRKGKRKQLFRFMGRRRSDVTDEPPPPPLPLVARCTVDIGIMDGSCRRRLSITCPDVEAPPPQCIVMNAGRAEVNGTYDMQGFRHGSPFYVNEAGVVLSREELAAKAPHTWVFGKPPSLFFYHHAPGGASHGRHRRASFQFKPVVSTAVEAVHRSAPPAENFVSLSKDEDDTPPSVMHNFTTRVKHTGQAAFSATNNDGETLSTAFGSRLSF